LLKSFNRRPHETRSRIFRDNPELPARHVHHASGDDQKLAEGDCGDLTHNICGLGVAVGDAVNTFKGIFLGTLLGIILWVIIAWVLWMIIGPRTQAFSHPPMTLREKQVVKQSIKKHGDYPITREGHEGIFIMTRGDERIRL
jgi:hypothetical protein